MESNVANLLGAGIAMLGTAGVGIGLGMIFSSWLTAIARNPGAADKLSTPGFIGFAATELVLLLCFVIAFMIIGAGGTGGV